MKYVIGIVFGFILSHFLWINLTGAGFFIPNVGGYYIEWSEE